MCYKNYLRHARLDLFKKQFVKNVDDTLDSLKKEHRRIIVKEFYNNKNIYWWTKYYSKSTFNFNDIEAVIEVEWNDKKSQKYIDLEYDDRIIRLDSMNQRVMDITNDRIIFY